ncbi:Histone H1-beta, late embryonic [Holothuria leucospilota]|uniref:Histone H1-beta, late embryonic n=1 Tax=Holothuria leucospilota TaxID=206669 RepID=A0A9Q1BZ70_HOLLE|nr:Histone H1-beta, late embryonic [Holothuria leucospilota]
MLFHVAKCHHISGNPEIRYRLANKQKPSQINRLGSETMANVEKKTATKKTSQPSTLQLVVNAIEARKEPRGSSAAAIKKTLETMGVDTSAKRAFINSALKKGVEKGILKQVKGVGATGTFKIDTTKAKAAEKAKAQKEKEKARKAKALEKEKAKKAAAKAKKAAAKAKKTSQKTKTKKPSQTKKKSAGTSTKKAAAGKKASKPKKTVKPKKTDQSETSILGMLFHVAKCHHISGNPEIRYRLANKQKPSQINRLGSETMANVEKKTATKKTSQPSTLQLVVNAIEARKEPRGSSAAAIKKTLETMGVDTSAKRAFINSALKKGVEKGILKQVKGVGATGTFKIDTTKAKAAEKAKAQKEKEKARKAKALEKEKAKKAAAKAKKAAAKAKKTSQKTKTKKPSQTKKKSAGTSTKKAAAGKKASKPKKTVKPKKTDQSETSILGMLFHVAKCHHISGNPEIRYRLANKQKPSQINRLGSETMANVEKKTATKKTSQPSTLQLVVNAIEARKEPRGSSAAAIKKTLETMGVDTSAKRAFINSALKKGVEKGILKQVKGVGATGTFKIDTTKAKAAEKAKAQKEKARKAKALEKEKAKKAAAKAKKAAAKAKKTSQKTKTKKPSQTKKKSAGTSTKKAAAGKKASKPKKTVKPKKTSKPTAKKTNFRIARDMMALSDVKEHT